MEIGKLYRDIAADHFVVIKILETNNDGFKFEIILSDEESQLGEKCALDKHYERDFILYNPNSKVRRLK